MLLVFLLVAFGSKTEAAGYRVKKGDTLSSVAKKNGVALKDLKRANPKVAGRLKPGSTLTIPSHKALAAKEHKGIRTKRVASAKRGKKADMHVAVAERVASGGYYVVKKGDTISSVANKYALTDSELRQLNGLKTKRLRKGQRLLVKRIGPRTYLVKKGDSLSMIAKKFDMEKNEIVELNELPSEEIRAGQKLYLEERVDASVEKTYREAVPKNMDEEIRHVSEAEDFAQKSLAEKLTIFSRKMLNIPYKFGGNSILGIDCSAYVKKVYGLLGIELPRTAREQFKVNESETIEKGDLSIGDLVFFRTYASFPSHVGIYLGNNLFIHASSRGKKVTIDSLETPYYLKRFIGGKRLLTDGVQEIDSETQTPNPLN